MLKKLLFGLGVLTVLSLAPKKVEAGELELAVGIGPQFSQSEEVIDKDQSPGFAIKGDAKFFLSPQLSIDLGLSHYVSQGENYSSSERSWFNTNTETYSESFRETSFNLGGSLHLRSNKNEISPYIGGGMKFSMFTENETYNLTGRDSYSDSETDVTDMATGPFFKFGFNVPKDNYSFFIEGEYRNTTKEDRSYPGLSLFAGINFPIE